LPVVPQVDAAVVAQVPCGSREPAGSGVHVPCLPAIPHELQGPQLATPQQNPSVQWPLMHSADVLHVVPLALKFVHEPDWHE
jgi:hypothetical protein